MMVNRGRRPVHQLARRWFAGSLLACAAASLTSVSAAQALSADEIVSRVVAHDRQRQSSLDHYESLRVYHLEYRGPLGQKQAQVQARMEFSAPDQKHFTVISEVGSALFCHEVLRKLMDAEREGALEANHMRAMLSPQNYSLKLVGEEPVEGVKAWVLDVTPRTDTKFNYKGRVWVNQSDYAVMRIVGTPAKNPTWLMSNSQFDYRYARNGAFWLPAKNITESHLRIGGDVTLTVDYGSYEIVPVSERRVFASRQEEVPRPGRVVRAAAGR